jgi:hypothetical protein
MQFNLAHTHKQVQYFTIFGFVRAGKLAKNEVSGACTMLIAQTKDKTNKGLAKAGHPLGLSDPSDKSYRTSRTGVAAHQRTSGLRNTGLDWAWS